MRDMATRAIKAQRRGAAQASLNKLVSCIASDYGIKRPPVALVRDPELQAVYDLEADLVVLQALYDYSPAPKKRSKKVDEKNKYNGTPDPKDEAPPEEALTIATADGTDTVVEAGTDDIIDPDADADANAPATEDDGA